jgi:hypothetical protein
MDKSSARKPVLPLARDYLASVAPQFDAVEDVKAYFGHGWDGVSRVLITYSSTVREFIQTCAYLGIQDGFQVRALWDLIKGGGKFDAAVSRFHNGLLSAFRGVHEEDFEGQWEQLARAKPAWQLMDKTHWVDLRCNVLALGATDKARLETYLEWNGILGYSDTIWAISQGEV